RTIVDRMKDDDMKANERVVEIVNIAKSLTIDQLANKVESSGSWADETIIEWLRNSEIPWLMNEKLFRVNLFIFSGQGRDLGLLRELTCIDMSPFNQNIMIVNTAGNHFDAVGINFTVGEKTKTKYVIDPVRTDD